MEKSPESDRTFWDHLWKNKTYVASCFALQTGKWEDFSVQKQQYAASQSGSWKATQIQDVLHSGGTDIFTFPLLVLAFLYPNKEWSHLFCYARAWSNTSPFLSESVCCIIHGLEDTEISRRVSVSQDTGDLAWDLDNLPAKQALGWSQVKGVGCAPRREESLLDKTGIMTPNELCSIVAEYSWDNSSGLFFCQVFNLREGSWDHLEFVVFCVKIFVNPCVFVSVSLNHHKHQKFPPTISRYLCQDFCSIFAGTV